MGARNIGIMSAVSVGLFTLLYIAWQYASAGPEAARIEKSLQSDLVNIASPNGANIVTRDSGWEPHQAHASMYYRTGLPITAIEDYYNQELPRLGWRRGARAAKERPRPSILIYHKGDREFSLTLGSEDAGWTYSTALVWKDR
jgi:hypothetical protein